MTRAVTGAIYVTVIILAVYFGGIFLTSVMGLITFFLLWEYSAMFKQTEYDPDRLRIAVLGLLIYSSSIPAVIAVNRLNHFGDIFIFMAVMGSAFIILSVFELFRKSKTGLWNILIGISGIIYILPAMILINAFSMLGPYEHQVFPLLGIFIMIWTFDTFAYLVGRKWGKTKMAPDLSPKKSWEGFAGGLVFTLIAGAVIAHFLDDQPYLAYILIGVVVTVFATIGDLFESMIKRNLGLKDSGKMIPGHGGILDRFDSVLFVIPATFFFTLFLMKFIS